MFQQEIDSVKLKQQNCISFYMNDMFQRWCACFGGTCRTNFCLPTNYSHNKNDILEKIMLVELHFDDDDNFIEKDVMV